MKFRQPTADYHQKKKRKKKKKEKKRKTVCTTCKEFKVFKYYFKITKMYAAKRILVLLSFFNNVEKGFTHIVF